MSLPFFNYYTTCITGVTVCAVAVGSSVNMNEVKAIGSKDCSFNPATFNKLSNMISYGIATKAHHPSNPTLHPNFFSGINLSKRLLQLLKKRYDSSEDSKNLA